MCRKYPSQDMKEGMLKKRYQGRKVVRIEKGRTLGGDMKARNVEHVNLTLNTCSR
jgi:hypothetical protein